jgi:hypothetical protein
MLTCSANSITACLLHCRQLHTHAPNMHHPSVFSTCNGLFAEHGICGTLPQRRLHFFRGEA